jgi:hypothetical protein
MTISMSTDPSINARVTRRFNAAPQPVFDAWLDSRSAGKWLFATAMGQIVCVEIDARAGGWRDPRERLRTKSPNILRGTSTICRRRYGLILSGVTCAYERRQNAEAAGCPLEPGSGRSSDHRG